MFIPYDPDQKISCTFSEPDPRYKAGRSPLETRGDYTYDPEPLADPNLVIALMNPLIIRDEDDDRIKLAKALAVIKLWKKLEGI